MADYPNVVRSPLSQEYSEEEISVRVEIYKVEGTEGWTLEVMDQDGGSTVWQDVFTTDSAAMAEFTEGVQALGLAQLIDPDEDDGSTVH
ncbi:hypothetical protein ASE63_05765 [Bosea sp. Root381]|jgi:hypothetical protein|uniref:hypothetical protein n=1 Tax=Bosea sp. Root381 TaxID=1736524 RepID=UPI0006F51F7D|nr:hypothetical protein [Bosea sp. Root381]KRE05828.1 hypothetical protein ASE63_05765 [Bosea sp. Root381]